MIGKALIVYGSRYGATHIIAERVAVLLSDAGYSTDVMDAKAHMPPPDAESYSLVIVGSGIKMGKWTKEAEKFIDTIGHDVPLGMFVSCAKVLDDPRGALVEYVISIAEKHGLSPAAAMAFGPIFDLSDGSRTGFLTKRMIKSIGKSLFEKNGVEFDEHGKNDFVDWDQVEQFVKEMI